jgi:hypothetical protein
MDDQQHHSDAMTKYRANFEVAEALVQSSPQLQSGKQSLKDDQSRKRGQSMVFEKQFGEAVVFPMDGRFAILHRNGLCWWMCVFVDLHFTNIKAVFLWLIIHLRQNSACPWTSRGVRSTNTYSIGFPVNNYGASGGTDG